MVQHSSDKDYFFSRVLHHRVVRNYIHSKKMVDKTLYFWYYRSSPIENPDISSASAATKSSAFDFILKMFKGEVVV